MDTSQQLGPRIIHLPRSPKEEAIDVLRRANLGCLDDYDIPETQGINSIVLFAKDRTDTVLKIPLGNQSDDAFANEVATIQKIARLDIKSLDIVDVKTIGYHPNYIVTKRLGTSLTEIWRLSGPPSPEEIREVGRVLADFVVEFHHKTGGMIHRDLHYENITRQPNGRYGCVDFGDCGLGDIETAFIQVAVREVPVFPAIMQRIHELTGRNLDLEKLEREAFLWIKEQE